MSDLIDRQEAIDAINALEYPSSLVDVKRVIVELPSAQFATDINVGDTISRKMAIDAFEPTHYIDWYTPTIIETLEALPFVKPEPHWIPCSERLPDEFGEYLVTKKAIGWNCEEYNSNDIAYFDNEGFHKADKVLAWMPLPKPYGGESDG